MFVRGQNSNNLIKQSDQTGIINTNLKITKPHLEMWQAKCFVYEEMNKHV